MRSASSVPSRVSWARAQAAVRAWPSVSGVRPSRALLMASASLRTSSGRTSRPFSRSVSTKSRAHVVAMRLGEPQGHAERPFQPSWPSIVSSAFWMRAVASLRSASASPAGSFAAGAPTSCAQGMAAERAASELSQKASGRLRTRPCARGSGVVETVREVSFSKGSRRALTVTSAVFTSASGPQRTSWVLRAAGLIEKDVVHVTADPFSGVAVTVTDAAPGTAPAAMSKRAVASPGASRTRGAESTPALSPSGRPSATDPFQGASPLRETTPVKTSPGAANPGRIGVRMKGARTAVSIEAPPTRPSEAPTAMRRTPPLNSDGSDTVTVRPFSSVSRLPAHQTAARSIVRLKGLAIASAEMALEPKPPPKGASPGSFMPSGIRPSSVWRVST